MRRGWMVVGNVGIVASIAVVIVAWVGGIAVASGGGGCGRPVTDETSSRIVIRNFCFGPTVARVRPGATVTFANRDGFSHTVLGANGSWGSFGTIRGGHSERYRFTRPGVYPYVCTYHPGMVGAVVVGRGAPRTVSTATTALGPVVHIGPAREAQLATRPAAAPAQASGLDTWLGVSWSAVPWTMAVLLFVAGAVVAYGRRRHRTIAA
jgi:plastocyanin